MTATSAVESGQKLNDQELEQARAFLEQTQNCIIGATKGLSEAQWRFKPSAEQWSVGENLHHVVTVLERVSGGVLEQIANAPAPPEGRDNQVIDAIIINQFPNRLAKFPAPEMVRPSGDFVPADALARLSATYKRLNDCLERRGLREHVVPALPLKAVSKGAYDVMDGYQWILAAAAHTERHTKQMLEVMASPDYPA